MMHNLIERYYVKYMQQKRYKGLITKDKFKKYFDVYTFTRNQPSEILGELFEEMMDRNEYLDYVGDPDSAPS